MGIGPRSMQPNDIVVVLRGGNTPFILRKGIDEQYHLVGEAYVHGILKGEAVRLAKARGEEEIVFPLR